jgi:hypothetical protein
MRGTKTIELAAALALVTLAMGCGGEAAAPVQTVDLSGLIEVDQLNEKLPVEKEELQAAIAETLQERAPAGVRIVYNPGAPPVQRLSQRGGGNQGSGKQKSPAPPPAPGTPSPPPETPAKPAPGENAPSAATCGFDPSKAGCENFCAQNPDFATCKKPAPVTPPPPETPAPAGGGKVPKPGDPAPKPTLEAGGDEVVEDCRYAQGGGVNCKEVGSGTVIGYRCPLPAAECAGVRFPVGDIVPLPDGFTPGKYSHCRQVSEDSTQCYLTREEDPVFGPPAPPELELCKLAPFFCGDGPDFDLPFFFKGVIDDSFEKVGVEFEPGSATDSVPLAEISIGGVKANVEASETGEIVSKVEEVSVPTSVPEQEGGDAEGAGEPVVEGEPGDVPAEGEAPADGTLPEEGTEPEGSGAPAAPSEAVPAPEAPTPVTPEPAPPAPAPPATPEPTQ